MGILPIEDGRSIAHRQRIPCRFCTRLGGQRVDRRLQFAGCPCKGTLHIPNVISSGHLELGPVVSAMQTSPVRRRYGQSISCRRRGRWDRGSHSRPVEFFLPRFTEASIGAEDEAVGKHGAVRFCARWDRHDAALVAGIW